MAKVAKADLPEPKPNQSQLWNETKRFRGNQVGTFDGPRRPENEPTDAAIPRDAEKPVPQRKASSKKRSQSGSRRKAVSMDQDSEKTVHRKLLKS